MNINEQLNSCYKTITTYEEKLRVERKKTRTLAMIFIVLIVIKILAAVVKIKFHISLPYWINWLV